MRHQVRVLLAWFERMDAISALLGFRMPADGEDVSVHAASYEAQRAALLARPAFVPSPMTVDPLPEAIADRAEELLKTLRPAGHRAGSSGHAHAQASGPSLSAGIVDLTRLISFQRAVNLEQIADRVAAAAPGDWAALAEICLPLGGAEEEDLHGTFDKDGRGVTITSHNPNLRVGHVRTVPGPEGGNARVIGFTLMFGTRHVHVVEYKGRHFLKDGYHRCHGLLARGITRVPAIYERARSFADVHSGSTTFVSQEYLLGTHPPMLTDFLHPGVSATVSQQAFRKSIRIRAEEFVVNV
jgi:hypothetical protein